MNSTTSIPKPTLKRLPIYYQYLNKYKDNDYISCTVIADALGQSPIQVRKDLQLTGAIGKPKIGYEIDYLIDTLSNFLGYKNINDAFLVGAGNFGKLLLNYNGFKEYGLNIVSAFDKDTDLVGTQINNINIFNITKFEDLVSRMNIKIGILTVSSNEAQNIADLMVKAGIEAIWNLTQAQLELPKDIICKNVNLRKSLSQLLSLLSNKYK